jgi:hypothetical protein
LPDFVNSVFLISLVGFLIDLCILTCHSLQRNLVVAEDARPRQSVRWLG